jgi:hypothetical protein
LTGAQVFRGIRDDESIGRRFLDLPTQPMDRAAGQHRVQRRDRIAFHEFGFKPGSDIEGAYKWLRLHPTKGKHWTKQEVRQLGKLVEKKLLPVSSD